MATSVNISQKDAEFLELAASHTGYSKEDMLEYSVGLLQIIMDWKLNSPSADHLESLESLEDDLIEALRLALKIEKVGGVKRIILEGTGRERWAITPEPDSILSRNKKIRRWR